MTRLEIVATRLAAAALCVGFWFVVLTLLVDWVTS